ncbi:MAG: ABC transporter ATP-binding protein [Bacteriovoracaceae bacterium]
MMEKLESAIEFKDVTKTFGTHTVLKHLNFKIPKGKITTILGFSGAGKSTLLKHILGLLTPSQGDVTVLGENLKSLTKTELRSFRQNFGMLFQYAALFDSMTASQNVEFPLKEFTDLSQEEREHKAQAILESVNLGKEAFHKLPSELSGGMRKRVGLARALALSPKIMLYDEPTTGLDPITTKMVNDLIVETSENHKDKEMTSLIISHDVKATLEISDFVAFLDHGNIVEYLPSDEFKKSENPLVKRFINL